MQVLFNTTYYCPICEDKKPDNIWKPIPDVVGWLYAILESPSLVPKDAAYAWWAEFGDSIEEKLRDLTSGAFFPRSDEQGNRELRGGWDVKNLQDDYVLRPRECLIVLKRA